MIKLGQIILKEINWVHNDKIRSYGFWPVLDFGSSNNWNHTENLQFSSKNSSFD